MLCWIAEGYLYFEFSFASLFYGDHGLIQCENLCQPSSQGGTTEAEWDTAHVGIDPSFKIAESQFCRPG